MFVRLSVCCGWIHVFKEDGLSDIHHIYMDRSEIYRGMSRNRLEVGPTNSSAGINRNADAIGEKTAKKPFFSSFLIKLRVLLSRYQLDILIQGRG